MQRTFFVAAPVLFCISGLCALGQRPSATAQRSPVVVNAGVPGENSTQLRGRAAQELAKWHPHFVVIYTGMNDAVNEKKFTSAQVFRSNVQALLDATRHAHATALLVAIQPVDEVRLLQRHAPDAYGTRQPNERISDRNALLQDLARRNHVSLVRFDQTLRAAGGPNETMSSDGVHLSARGYTLLAQAVWQVLAKRWQTGEPILCLGDSLTYGQGVRPQGAGLLAPDGTAFPTYPEVLNSLAARHG